MNTRIFERAPLAAGCAILLGLGGCGVALIEAPNYHVSEVQSFKVAGAPSGVMMLEIIDPDNTLPAQTWADALSDQPPPPRLRFVTDPADVKDGQTLKAENRLVAVVNPSQNTFGNAICTDPQTGGMEGISDRLIVRFGFCVGDDLISETRARFVPENFETQLYNNADTISFQLFPRHMRNNDDDRTCSPFETVC
ncbi:hypothetical protein [Thalassospira profundimaris]|uniref:Lipoprotein n=1 Tax=Thalassospira profundimaris TaxID=502049 RepID=A0A367WKI3_9PROT|nr:hypothetical protein [Thalassospira profundimaris]RCK41965.1 hypothetical protein TH30_21405 [Thalassospira profundimaris]